MSAKNSLKLVQRALEIKHRKDSFYLEVKCGPSVGGAPRIDAVALAKSWTNPCVTGYEIKVDRNDFFNDTKWQAYLEFCHKFFFACPKGLIKKEEVPAPAGLVYCSEKGARIVKNTAHSPKDISAAMLYYLIMWRERYPDRQRERRAERFREWVEEKKNFFNLSGLVNKRIREKVDDLSKRERAVIHNEEKYRNVISRIGVLDKMLKPLRINVGTGSSWELDNLKKLVAGKVAGDVVENLEKAREELDEALAALGG